MTEITRIGGSGSAEKPRKPKNAQNTLQSKTLGRTLDLLCYGPIKGVVGGAAGVYLENTPVMTGETPNFEGIDLQFRNGLPYDQQEMLSGFDAIETPVSVSAELKVDAPRIINITGGTDAVLITYRIPSLIRVTEDGDRLPYHVSFGIDIQEQDEEDNWRNIISETISGKCTSPYEFTVRVDFPPGGPFSLRLRRGTPAASTDIQDDLYIQYFVMLQETKLNYPNCALVAGELDAEYFGDSIPSRSYLTDLRLVRIPNNYNPETREYSGEFWDGGFAPERQWTDNPAWCFYDLVTDPFIGAGLPENQINKWQLYQIAKYCDGLVDDGRGGSEPRFTCNVYIDSQGKALEVLAQMSSIFRGFVYWGSDQLCVVADQPTEVSRIVSPADVIDGEFKYAGGSLDTMHSVVVVEYIDPNQDYELVPEVVEDRDAIREFGYRETKVTAFACASRTQARRLGQWMLYSERAERDNVSFSMPAAGFDIRPGDVIQLSDPLRAGTRVHGRLMDVDGSTLTIDAAPEVSLASGWKITVNTKEGVETLDIVAHPTPTTITVTGSTANLLIADSYVLHSNSLNPATYRVMQVKEDKNSVYKVEASAYDPGKFEYIEEGRPLPEIPVSKLPTNRLTSPTNLAAQTYRYLEGNDHQQGIQVSWTAPANAVAGLMGAAQTDPRTNWYVLAVQYPDSDEFVTLYEGAEPYYELKAINPNLAGTWRFRVAAQGVGIPQSAWVTSSDYVFPNLLVPPKPTNVVVASTNTTITLTPEFAGQSFSYECEFYRATTLIGGVEAAELIGVGYSIVDVGQGETPIALTWGTEYYYYVRSVNAYGESDFYFLTAFTASNAEEILKFIWDEDRIAPGTVGQEIYDELKKVSGDGAGSVNERLDDLKQEIGEDIEAIQESLSYYGSIPEWDNTSTYPLGSLAHFSGTVYRALQNVPADITPPNATYWKDIGTLSSQMADTDDALGSIEELKISDAGLALTQDTLTARFREYDYDEDEDLRGALATWENTAKLIEQKKVIADNERSLVERTTLMLAQFRDDTEGRVVQLEQLQSDLSQTIYTQQQDVELRFRNTTAHIQQVQSSLAADNHALFSELTDVRSEIAGVVSLSGELSDLIQLLLTEQEAQFLDILDVKLRLTDTENGLNTVTGEIGNTTALLLDTREAVYEAIEQLDLKIDLNDLNAEGKIDTLQSLLLSDEGAFYEHFTSVAASVVPDGLGEVMGRIETLESLDLYPNSAAYQAYKNISASVVDEFGATVAGWVEDERSLTLTDLGAVNTRIDQMGVRVDTAESKVTNIANLQVDDTSALGLLLQSLEVGQINPDGTLQVGAVEQISRVTSTLNGLSSQHSLAISAMSDGRQVVTGMKILSDITGDTTRSEFIIQADKFKLIPSDAEEGAELTSPFMVEDGKVYLNSAIINEAVVGALEIGKTIKSKNFDLGAAPNAAGYNGWMLHENGSFIIRGAQGGASTGSVEMTKYGIVVRDGNGNVRVKLGNLNALGTPLTMDGLTG